MKFMEKAKRFFTLNAANHEGFTLVELIVVIAILAILAGVAVPAYSGYIKKAQAAGDDELLAAVNTAFVSACLANGESNVGRDDVKALGVNADGTVKDVGSNAVINASFAEFFKGNETAAFKVNKDYLYSKTEGIFTKSEAQTFMHNEKGFVVSGTAYAAITGSIWATSDKISGGDIVKEVDSVVDFAAGKVNSNALLSNLVNEDAYQEVFATMYPDADLENASEQEKMSALVVYTAQNSKDLDNEDVYNKILNGDGGYSYITGDGDDTQDVATMAMHYAVGMVWAKENNIEYENPEDLFAIMSEKKEVENDWGPSTYEDSDFVKWLQTDSGKETAMSAMDGYKGAMDVIGSNSGNISGSDLLGDDDSYVGFGGYEDLINQILGK